MSLYRVERGDLVGELTTATHHISMRRSCASCGTRVFTFSDEIDSDGRVLRHFCRMCTQRLTTNGDEHE